MELKNVYFVIGTSYAGKSTIVKNLAAKHNGIELEEPDPQAALDNYREILTRICSKESYDELENSGFKVIYRDENRTQEETVKLAETLLGIEDNGN